MDCRFEGTVRQIALSGTGRVKLLDGTALGGLAERVELPAATVRVGPRTLSAVLLSPSVVDVIQIDELGKSYEVSYDFRGGLLTVHIPAGKGAGPGGGFKSAVEGDGDACARVDGCQIHWPAGKDIDVLAHLDAQRLAARGPVVLTGTFPFAVLKPGEVSREVVERIALSGATGQLRGCGDAGAAVSGEDLIWSLDQSANAYLGEPIALTPEGLRVRVDAGAEPKRSPLTTRERGAAPAPATSTEAAPPAPRDGFPLPAIALGASVLLVAAVAVALRARAPSRAPRPAGATMSPAEQDALAEALMAAFPDYDKLEAMLQLKLGRNLADHAAKAGLEVVVPALVKAAIAGGWIRDLITGAHRRNPGNEKLKRFYETYIGPSEAPDGG
jgi:hypothetical protein